MARIQGSVRFSINPVNGTATLVSGHPLLAPAAKLNLSKWRFAPPFEEAIFVEYQFDVEGEPKIVKRRVPRGGAFDRFFQRMFRMRTYEEDDECVPSNESQVSMKTSAGNAILVSISTPKACVMVESSY